MKRADDMNKIIDGQLVCGARKINGPGYCDRPAGEGTRHTGRGRCKRHGGNSTGPQTAAGRARSSKNSRKHGGYSLVQLIKTHKVDVDQIINQIETASR